MAADAPIPIQRTYSVALSRPTDSTFNTLELGGLDLVIPLERDLDKRPDEPDEIRLASDDDSYAHTVRSDDPSVKPDGGTPLLLYPFPNVPPGFYSIGVRVGPVWVTVLRGLRVTRTTVFLGEKSFEQKPDGSSLGRPEAPPEEESIEIEDLFDGDPHCLCCA